MKVEFRSFNTRKNKFQTLDLDLNCNKEQECEDMFNAKWLEDCRQVVDPTNYISDCSIDLCLAGNKVESKRKLLNDYITTCQTAQSAMASYAPSFVAGAAPAPASGDICNWTELSGLGREIDKFL